MGEPAAAQQIRGYQRINVIGTSGSGKTTFARELARRLELPYVEMDPLFWKPGWRESPDAEFLPRVEEAASGARWVLDGSYSRSFPVSWRRVQLVVWLDTSFVRTIARVTARTIRRGLSRQELWAGTGNRESLVQAFFSRKSIIWWAITTHRRNRARYSALMASPEHARIAFVRLRSPGETQRFLEAA
jgi:adenylate kinase family enzyme